MTTHEVRKLIKVTSFFIYRGGIEICYECQGNIRFIEGDAEKAALLLKENGFLEDVRKSPDGDIYVDFLHSFETDKDDRKFTLDWTEFVGFFPLSQFEALTIAVSEEQKFQQRKMVRTIVKGHNEKYSRA